MRRRGETGRIASVAVSKRSGARSGTPHRRRIAVASKRSVRGTARIATGAEVEDKVDKDGDVTVDAGVRGNHMPHRRRIAVASR
jgi:hypothetical protein